MKLDKNQLRGLIVIAIAFVVFTVVAFALPFAMNGIFWLAYIFTAIAILGQVYVLHIAFDKGEAVKSKLYGFPIARIGFIYLIAQLVLGLVFMALAKIAPAWLAIVLFILVFAAAGVGFIAADMMRDEVEKQEVQLKKDVTLMRSLQSKASFITSQCTDPDTKSALEKLSEDLRFSDPVSSEGIADAEASLVALVDELQAAVINGDNATARALCTKASVALAERNQLCKLGK